MWGETTSFAHFFIKVNLMHFWFIFLLQLSTDVSGKGAATKVRGRLRDKEEEERAKKEANEAFRKDLEARYAKWNKG